MDVAAEQNFRAEVVSDPGEKVLIEQESGKGAVPECRILALRDDVIRGATEHIRADGTQVGMRFEGFGIQHVNLAGAVEQGCMVRRLNFEAQAAGDVGIRAGFRNVPAPVKLIVAIDVRIAFKSNHETFAVSLHIEHFLFGQLPFKRLEVLMKEPGVGACLASQHFPDFLGFKMNFGSFGHLLGLS